MATIQINRTKTGVVPGSLADGELYIDQLNNKLYWADSTGVIKSLTLLLPTFAASATTDTTNATNITSGRLASAQGGIPAGALMDFAMPSAPTGWLACDGSAVSRTTYADLFAAIGTYWGIGDGSTTFNLPPDGYFRRGWKSGGTVDPARAFASIQADAFKSHTHTLTDPGHTHAVGNTGNLTSPGVANTYFYASAVNSLVKTSKESTGITIASTGSTETRPKNIAVLTCIKT